MSKMCPECGDPNQCAMESGFPPEQCWCMKTSSEKNPFMEEVIKERPSVLIESGSCYCQSCLAKIKSATTVEKVRR